MTEVRVLPLALGMSSNILAHLQWVKQWMDAVIDMDTGYVRTLICLNLVLISSDPEHVSVCPVDAG